MAALGLSEFWKTAPHMKKTLPFHYCIHMYVFTSICCENNINNNIRFYLGFYDAPINCGAVFQNSLSPRAAICQIWVGLSRSFNICDENYWLQLQESVILVFNTTKQSRFTALHRRFQSQLQSCFSKTHSVQENVHHSDMLSYCMCALKRSHKILVV